MARDRDVGTVLLRLFGPRFSENRPLREFTTFRTGGPGRFVVFPETAAEVAAVMDAASGAGVPWTVLGGGSNVLISDAGFPGIVVLTGRMDQLRRRAGRVTAGGGARISSLMRFLLREGLGGLEFLVGIPGTVGGAVVMNAGLKDIWISRNVEKVILVREDGSSARIAGADAEFGYRTSGLAGIVTEVALNTTRADPERMRKEMRALMLRRKATQPLDLPCAGSVFRNPPGGFAGEIVEGCGLKGFRIGDAGISEKHANFIVNLGNAASSDIYRLIRHVQECAARKYNLTLELEIRLVGKMG